MTKATPPKPTPANTTPAKDGAQAGQATPAKKATPASDATQTGQDTPAKATPTSDATQTGHAAPGKKAAPTSAATPAGQATPAKKATPTSAATETGQAAPARNSVPAKKVTKSTAARRTAPLKKAVKAAASELAPAVVEPDMTTVPDEPTPTPEEKAATSAPSGPAARAAAATPSGSEPKASSPAEQPSPGKEAGATTRAAEPPATAPGQPGAVVPVQQTLPPQIAPSTDTESVEARRRSTAAARFEAWARILADPAHSPELLAVAAVQTIGPRAAEWAQRMRDAYPAAGPDAIARLAVQQFTRFGSVNSVFAAVAGSYAPIALLGAAALTQAELALHVAAAYGVDPADPARAVDLLVLTRVHPEREDAEAALVSAQEHSYEGAGLTDAAWRLGRMVAVHAGGWAVLRVANRYFPGASLLAAVLTSRAAAQTMGARATLFYRR
ncbi:hypothetical protein AB0368_30925 [Actinoplanes sp. NPDC051475]|uniref:hypothetical protein n=1 Tax=Actinoplanes sp. NPDC051475 TaxID=3157225 RepID=UPI0034503EC6